MQKLGLVGMGQWTMVFLTMNPITSPLPTICSFAHKPQPIWCHRLLRTYGLHMSAMRPASERCAPDCMYLKYIISGEGDHVFVLHHEDTIPGGAFGIRARNEILTVTRVNPSGTLDLVNQAGCKFTRHIEQCAPCSIPNIEGTVHAHLQKPSAMHPCTRCGDHLQADIMLLCDSCNAGWHIHCLPVPLAAVPDDPIWICPDCQKAGFTPEAIEADRARYVPAPDAARPHMELPSPARLRKAQKVADRWHGQIVEHYRGDEAPSRTSSLSGRARHKLD